MNVTATAKRWEHGWELHIDDVGVTQSPTLSAATKMVREYVASLRDIEDEDSIAVDLTVDLDGDVNRLVKHAKNQSLRAASMQEDAARQLRSVTRELADARLSQSDIAIVLGVSRQRVSQLMKANHNEVRRESATVAHR